jgi:hypothetical protein
VLLPVLAWYGQEVLDRGPVVEMLGQHARVRGLGEDGKGILYPVDNHDVVWGFLLDFLGHREQAGLIQSNPP